MSTKNLNNSDDQRNKVFLRLFVANQKAVYAYILALVQNVVDAEDIMQETAALMWDRFDSFDPDSNFGAWAVTIARYKVLEYHNRKKRDFVLMSEDLFEQISKTASTKIGRMSDRLRALEQCLSKLNDEDRKLIEARYERGLAINKIAEHLKRPVGGMYRVMTRIHNALLRCVSMTMTAWGAGS